MAAPTISLKDASHVLFRILSRFKAVHGDYKNLVNGLHSYIGTVPGVIQIKLTTILGNSEPSNPHGETQRFLNIYFSGMDGAARIRYFLENYHGTQDEYNAFLNEMRKIDDGIRIRLVETESFIILGLTNRSPAGDYNELYHITISRNINYDVQGQYGIPTGAEVLQSIHLTDETTQKHYFVKYSSFSSPLNEDAASLLAYLKPGRFGGRKTIRRKKSKRSKRKGTLKTGVRR